MKYHLIIYLFYLIQMLWVRAQLFLTNPRFFLLSHVVFWVKCGTWLHRWLIFAVFLTLKGGCTGPPESAEVKMSHCWKSHDASHMFTGQGLRCLECSDISDPYDCSRITTCGSSEVFLLTLWMLGIFSSFYCLRNYTFLNVLNFKEHYQGVKRCPLRTIVYFENTKHLSTNTILYNYKPIT